MTSKTEIVKTKSLKVYNGEAYEILLKGVKTAACMINESHQIVDETSVLRRLSALTVNGPSDGNCCSACGVGPFETREEQISHYKNHWHTHNLKRKLFGKPALSLGQFKARQDDDSSVSGSDSESEGDPNKPASDLFAACTRHCKAFFTNADGQVFCIYRCILHHRKEELSTDGHGCKWVERCQRLTIPLFLRWAVLMVSGGHFAGAVFEGNIVVCHKTFHSYVTRKGQGHAQVTRDERHSSHAPRSAGSSLRRYNQAQFIEHVQEILASWAQTLVTVNLILYRAVGPTNQSALFGKNSPLSRDDLRVRALPFPTRKPTYKEVKRVHETVASIEVYESMEQFQKALMASMKPASKINSDSSSGLNKKTQKNSPNKVIDRAKSRERAPRELPVQIMSSEDEGPCYIDSETPKDWIKTLSEQSNNRLITNSRKDLLNDGPSDNSDSSDGEQDVKKEQGTRKKKKKKPEDTKSNKEEKRGQKAQPVPSVPANITTMWKAISGCECNSLETILESWEGSVEAACNTQDPSDGNTALHKAAIADKPEIVTKILSVGGDPCIKNHQLQTPYAATPNQETRIAFRIFQAQNPEKYNYAKSQIPGPITLEQLEQEKEKKSQQKKAKRQREKEKQQEKAKTAKFLELNDTEKIKSGERRCFMCGTTLPKRPFQYEQFKFCDIKCLQNHRNLRRFNQSR